MARRPHGFGNHTKGPLLSDRENRSFTDGPADLVSRHNFDVSFLEFDKVEDVNPTTGWVATAIGAVAAQTFVLRTSATDLGTFVINNPGTANSTGMQYNRTNFIDSIPVNNNASRTVDWGWGCRMRLDNADGGAAFVGLESSPTPAAVLSTAGALVGSIHLAGFHMTPSGTSSQIATVFQIGSGAVAPSVVSGELLSDDEWVILSMHGHQTFSANNWVGGAVKYYVNGVQIHTVIQPDVGTAAYTASTGGYRHTLAAVNGAAAVLDMEVDFIYRWFSRL